MFVCDLRFPGYDAAARRTEIRWALFLHPGVRDVLATSRADTLCLVFRGEADFAGWTATLVDAGFPPPSPALDREPAA